MSGYQEKLSQQIEQFREVTNIHDLPDIFHYWTNKYLRQPLNEVMGVNGVSEFYARHLAERFSLGEGRRILSVGSGDCSVDMGVAQALKQMDVDSFQFDCLELSPYLLERARANTSDLYAHFNFIECDANRSIPSGPYVGVMAHHSLHHIVELEFVFERIREALTPSGVFLTNDMIGRNGHMRWPEALEIIEALWRFLPDKYKYNHPLRRLEEAFQNHDCSTEGFEGIRAQDILPLLRKYFHFEKFLAFGNLQDIFIDRGFGHNLDPKNAQDCALIDFLELLNTLLIDLGHLKPTQMYAVMGKRDAVVTRVFKHWTPEFCYRDYRSTAFDATS